MDIYHYDRLTGVLTGQSVADLDPIEGKPLVPAHATATKPPVKKAGHALVFHAAKATWRNVPDNRGKVYSKVDGAEAEHLDLGDLPADKTNIKPLDDLQMWSDDKGWVPDNKKIQDLAAIEKERKDAENDNDESLDGIIRRIKYIEKSMGIKK